MTLLFDIYFKQKLHDSTGNDTQNEFKNLCKQYYGDDFHTPNGLKEKGDEGADGIVKTQGIYFQVNSPEQNKDQVASNKMKKDLIKIINSSHIANYPIKKYIFFYNQPKEIDLSKSFYNKIEELKKKFLIDISIWRFSDVKRELFDKLTDYDKQRYLEIYGNQDYQFSNKVMDEICNQIVSKGNGGRGIFESKINRQEFDEKITHNNFDDSWRSFWNAGMKHIHDVEDYFKLKSETREKCYDTVVNVYNNLENINDDSNRIIEEMVHKFTPVGFKKPENCFHVSYILVYFFQKCSIFKNIYENE
jgi:NAD-dependent SIR2 family protein deacetylase